jgi:hypothetical protein
MAYSTGTGSTQQDFLDALRAFAVTAGWTVTKWDTTNKRLYLEKGVCHVAMEWFNTNVNTYTNGTSTLVTVSEGWIRGTLCQTLGASNDYTTFAGNAAVSGWINTSGPLVAMSNMQGPYVSWFLFTNATGDYIHAIVQTSADMYGYLFFGNADKGTLTHSGAAYMASDAGRKWYREGPLSSFAPSSESVQWNSPDQTTPFFGEVSSRWSYSQFHLYCENALPAGFINQQTMASGFPSTSVARTAASPVSMKSNGRFIRRPTDYQNLSTAGNLLDNITMMSAPGHTPYVPMIGIPLMATNVAKTQACAVGSVPDIRVINLTNMAPQQEIVLGADTWKVFPMLRQTPWTDVKVVDAASSGQWGIALKKI